MKLFIATTCLAASFASIAFAHPIRPSTLLCSQSPTIPDIALAPATPQMTTVTSTQVVPVTPRPVSVQRPILKDTLHGTTPPMKSKCRPICIEQYPCGHCITYADSCSLPQSGLSRISMNDRLVALLAAAFALSIDWRLSVLFLFGADYRDDCFLVCRPKRYVLRQSQCGGCSRWHTIPHDAAWTH